MQPLDLPQGKIVQTTHLYFRSPLNVFCRRRFTALSLATALCAALMSATLAPQARAQSDTEVQGPPAPERITNGKTFGAWAVTCEALAVNETTCVLSQRLFRDTDRAFIAQIMAFWAGNGEELFMSARVPTGVALPAGFVLRPASGGEDDLVQFTYQTCDANTCEAIAQIDSAFVESTRTEDGQAMVASFRPGLTAEPFIFRFSAEGMAQGLAALKPKTTN